MSQLQPDHQDTERWSARNRCWCWSGAASGTPRRSGGAGTPCCSGVASTSSPMRTARMPSRRSHCALTGAQLLHRLQTPRKVPKLPLLAAWTSCTECARRVLRCTAACVFTTTCAQQLVHHNHSVQSDSQHVLRRLRRVAHDEQVVHWKSRHACVAPCSMPGILQPLTWRATFDTGELWRCRHSTSVASITASLSATVMPTCQR